MDAASRVGPVQQLSTGHGPVQYQGSPMDVPAVQYVLTHLVSLQLYSFAGWLLGYVNTGVQVGSEV